ncbi:putative bifunctional diguanylate cyclase/phosphodiesterase [Stakelama tenebrarum]|uniref:EAL domain-containing protein n=1 Tax=Stakelama tenebrarum TaxID=2711215 RepID=A0A6G6Y6M1_9SPHN|nr:EAL domain-containing protein [Sphingosinithalassobacter tenebrarum]QIG80594.1 EAL domain-containing protein [Sphingosinithalassobacter tenebrarum]
MSWFDAFDGFAEFAASHEAWELDEIFVLLMLMGNSGLIIATRRTIDARREIARREEAEARAMELARHDPLTGLANRRVLGEELEEMLHHAAHRGCECAVFVIDLDQFKPVNDLYGHEAGDAVLVGVAERLREVAGDQSVIARLGGDEFVCVLPCQMNGEAPARMASALQRRLSEPFHVCGATAEVGATIGIALCPADGTDVETLLRSADVAMYEAKREKRGSFRFFHAEMDAKLRERAKLETDLRAALDGGAILPYFQPVMALGDSRIAGFEALARWQHPERGVIAPDEFIPVAEDMGLIGQLTETILRQSCIAARNWPPRLTLSINIAPLQLKDEWLASRLLSVLTETGFAPSRLIVEVTENAIIDDVDQAAEVFASLQNAGIRIALDDFGKGYSSLSHLRQLRFNHLKIDSSFVRSMDSAESQKIVSAVSGLGKALGMPVTAEGVESAAIADALRALGCEQAQGYLFGMPVPADQLELLLAKSAAKPVRIRKTG